MRLPWALLVGGVFISGVAASPDHLGERQATAPSASGSPSTASSGGDENGSSTGNGGGSSTGGGDSDTTVFQTVTVTNGGGVDTVTQTTTDFTSTTTRVITAVRTSFSTATVTSSNADVATKTVYVTSTILTANAKRFAHPRTIAPARVSAAVVARAAPTDFPGFSFLEIDEAVQKRAIEKRATVTEIDTVTVAGRGGTTTVVRTVDAVSTRFSTTTRIVTDTITETDQVNAKSTTTVTSTLTVTSASDAPTSTSGGDSSGDSSGNSGSSSGGLSTGAKAGIGAGVGVAGLAIIALAIWFLVRRHRRTPKPIHDDVIGHSEVPVGPSGGGRSPTVPSMSQASNHAGFLAAGAGRTSMKSNSTAEGYRGTAAGDGRAGYAKPQPYGAAYKQAGHGGYGQSNSPPSNSPNYAAARTETLKSQTESHAESAEMDAVGQQGSYRAPEGDAVEMGYDDAQTGYRRPQGGANEMDSGVPTADRKRSGPIYEMPTSNF